MRNTSNTTTPAISDSNVLEPVFCFPDCKYLSITEFEQDNLPKGKFEDHYCTKYNCRIRHVGYHPNLPRLKECNYDNSEIRNYRYTPNIEGLFYK